MSFTAFAEEYSSLFPFQVVCVHKYLEWQWKTCIKAKYIQNSYNFIYSLLKMFEVQSSPVFTFVFLSRCLHMSFFFSPPPDSRIYLHRVCVQVEWWVWKAKGHLKWVSQEVTGACQFGTQKGRELQGGDVASAELVNTVWISSAFSRVGTNMQWSTSHLK